MNFERFFKRLITREIQTPESWLAQYNTLSQEVINEGRRVWTAPTLATLGRQEEALAKQSKHLRDGLIVWYRVRDRRVFSRPTHIRPPV